MIRPALIVWGIMGKTDAKLFTYHLGHQMLEFLPR
jgi:hypothetical protein